MKYKVGDRVRIRKGLEVGKVYERERGFYYLFLADMKKYEDNVYEIEKVYSRCYYLKDVDYTWTDEMLEAI